MNKFLNLQFLFRKPKVILVTGSNAGDTRKAILHVLGSKFRADKDILVVSSELKDEKELKRYRSLARKSPLFILVVGHFGNLPFDQEVLNFIKTLPHNIRLVLNFDNQAARVLSSAVNLKIYTFGFEETVDFRVTDINSNGGTNFKINFEENIVPVWLEGVLNKEQIYSVLAAICVSTIFNLNLVEISQALKDYRSH